MSLAIIPHHLILMLISICRMYSLNYYECVLTCSAVHSNVQQGLDHSPIEHHQLTTVNLICIHLDKRLSFQRQFDIWECKNHSRFIIGKICTSTIIVNVHKFAFKKLKVLFFLLTIGDNRVNVIPTLGAVHTLLVREHNRIAEGLNNLNRQWSNGKVFDETRKIMGAIIQHVTYNEWLPIVIGDQQMDQYDLKSSERGHVSSYDSNLDPSIRNSFAAAALRYAHSLIMPTQAYLDRTYRNEESFSLETQQLNPHMVVQENGRRLEDLVRWTTYKPCMTSDR